MPKISRFDAKVLPTIVQRLVRELQPQEIFLFGSHAWGEPHAHSDIDLCVVVADGTVNFRALDWINKGLEALADLDISPDIKIVKRSQMEALKQVPASLHRKIAVEGKLLYSNVEVGATVPEISPVEAKLNLVESWLKKSRDALKVNRAVVAECPSIAASYCHVAAYSALKGFLVWHDVFPGKSTNLASLLERAAAIEPTLSQKLADIVTLERYDEESLDPSVEPDSREASSAFSLATKAYGIICQTLALDGMSEDYLLD